jgi:hypothetical protein
MKKAVMCIVPDHVQAESLVRQLHAAGFSGNDISVVFPDRGTTTDFARENDTKAAEGAVAGAGAGTVVGGTMGLLAGLTALTIPGLGPFLAVGPLIAALSGIAAGATVGGLTGALIGMGIPELDARRFESKIRGGKTLVAVHTDTGDQRTAAERIFESARADDIWSVTESVASPKLTPRGV